MARERKRRKAGNVVTVNFDGVQSNVALPEAEQCRLKVVSATHKDNDGDGSIMVRIQVLKSDNKKIIGKETNIYFNLSESSLWVLRNFLEALGAEIPEGPMDIALDDWVDLEFVADITQNTYNDRVSNRLANFTITDGSDKDSEESEDEDEDEVVVKGKKSKAKDEDEEDEEDEDEAPKSRKKSKAKDEDEEEDEDEAPKKKSKKAKDEDEEDDEDEAPKKKSKKSTTYVDSELQELSEKELKAIIKKHDLDVDLDDYPNRRKKAMAVSNALDEEGLLEQD